MQSTSFRLVSAVTTLLLLAGLIWVVMLVVRTAPTAPVTRLSTPTLGTSPQAASLEVSPTPTGTHTLSTDQQPVALDGFTFAPIPNYELDLTATSATLTSAGGTIFLLRGGAPDQLTATATTDLDELFDEFVDFYAQRDSFTSTNKQTIQLAGVDGRTVDLLSRDATDAFTGRIVMAQPATSQLFLLVAVSPTAEWQATAQDALQQLLASVTFSSLAESTPVGTLTSITSTTAASQTPTPRPSRTPSSPPTQSTQATPDETAEETPAQTPSRSATTTILRPTATPLPRTTATPAPASTSPLTTTIPTHLVLPRLATAVATNFAPTPTRPSPTNWRVYSNGNRVHDLTVLNTTIWAATDGGVSRWNRSNNSFTKYTTLDGLTVNQTTSVLDCGLPGFGLLFGSSQGLQIFEQARAAWKTLSSANSEMHFNDISALYCSVEYGFLVVGYTQHGLDIYDAKSESWTLIDQSKGLPSDTVTALTVIGDREQIWLASPTGVSVLTADGVIVYDTRNTPLETNEVQVIVSNELGVIWLGAGNKVYKIDQEQWTIYSDAYVLASSFPTDAITALLLMGDGTIWIGSAAGELCHFDPAAVTCQAFFAPTDLTITSSVTGLALDTQNRLYVATAQDGVRMLDEETWHPYRAPDDSILSSRVHTFAQTADGLIWLATDTGLYQIDPADEQVLQSFTPDNTEYPVDAIVTLFLDPAGGLWAGGQGVGYLDGDAWTIYTTANGLASDQVQAIAGDAEDRIWIGTAAGLSIWNGDSFFSLTQDDRLPSDNILALLADEATMWVGSAAGLLRFENNQFQIYQLSGEASSTTAASSQIHALAKVADGALLVGTDQGLARWVAHELNLVEETADYSVRAIGLDQTDRVWLGTGNNGLFYFDGAVWTTPPQNVLAPSPTINAILVDSQNSVWIATEGGLLRYIP